jgi:hypothetical protein
MRRLKTLLGTTALLAGLALAPAANAQVVVDIGVQPVCSYGYYGYAPYACAPMGYYGPGYFYNGIFLGMGPWGGWGYSHGWGGHRFSGEGGGSYHGGPGRASYHENGGGEARGGGAGYHSNATGIHPAARGGTAHAVAARPVASHTGSARPNAGHSAAPHSSGGAAHGRGERRVVAAVDIKAAANIGRS